MSSHAVNLDLDGPAGTRGGTMGATAPGQATVVLTDVDAGLERARFTGDWSTHPWQPTSDASVRLGFNGHAADWTATEVEVRYLDL